MPDKPGDKNCKTFSYVALDWKRNVVIPEIAQPCMKRENQKEGTLGCNAESLFSKMEILVHVDVKESPLLKG